MDNMEEPGVSGSEMNSEYVAENQEFVEGQDYSSVEDEDEESGDDSASDDGDEGEDNEEEEGEEVEENEDDDDDDDDEDDEEEDEESEEEEVLSQSGEAVEAEGASSGDETSDRCPICLNRLRQQDVGMPETCDHLFCLECIQEWSKNVNTCPVDRQVFHIILAKHAGEDKVFKQFPVENRQQLEEEEEEAAQDDTVCEVCGRSDREDRLLLCDSCDAGYHCECLDSPLDSVPVHEWFCPDCVQSRSRVEEEPLLHGRQIARTRVSERVRRIIADARAARARRRQVVAQRIADRESSMSEEAFSGPSSSLTTPRRRGTKRKRTTRKRKTPAKKRKTTRKRKTTKKRTPGKKTKRKKRKTKGKGKSPKTPSSSAVSPGLARTAQSSVSVKGRIADRLGLKPPPSGRSIPIQKGSGSGGSGGPLRHEAAPSFSIMGSKDELYSFAEHEGEERVPLHRPAIPASTLSRSALSSHRPLGVGRIAHKRRPVAAVSTPLSAIPSSGPQSCGSGTCDVGTGQSNPPAVFDLLGSIMSNQDLLHKGSKNITIKRDGSLSAASSSLEIHAASRNIKLTKTPPSGTASVKLENVNEGNVDALASATTYHTSSIEIKNTSTMPSHNTGTNDDLSTKLLSPSKQNDKPNETAVMTNSSLGDVNEPLKHSYSDSRNESSSLGSSELEESRASYEGRGSISDQNLKKEVCSAGGSERQASHSSHSTSSHTNCATSEPAFPGDQEDKSHHKASHHSRGSRNSNAHDSAGDGGSQHRSSKDRRHAVSSHINNNNNSTLDSITAVAVSGNNSIEEADLRSVVKEELDKTLKDNQTFSENSIKEEGENVSVTENNLGYSGEKSSTEGTQIKKEIDSSGKNLKVSSKQGRFVKEEIKTTEAYNVPYFYGDRRRHLDFGYRGQVFPQFQESPRFRDFRFVEDVEWSEDYAIYEEAGWGEIESPTKEKGQMGRMELKRGVAKNREEVSSNDNNGRAKGREDKERDAKGDKEEGEAKRDMEKEETKGDWKEGETKEHREDGEAKGDRKEGEVKGERKEGEVKGERKEEEAKGDGEEGEAKGDEKEGEAKGDKKEREAKGDMESEAEGDREEGEAKEDREEEEAKGDGKEACTKKDSEGKVDREEGEASDSGEEGELTDEKERKMEEDFEEGEIVEEEEDANKIEVKEEKSLTDQSVSGVSNKTKAVSGSPVVNAGVVSTDLRLDTDLGASGDLAERENKDEADEELDALEEEESSEDEFDPDNPVYDAFMIGKFLESLRNNEFDRKKEKAARKEAIRLRREAAAKRKEEERIAKENAKISILDFIGNASAKKFGVYAPPSDPKKDEVFAPSAGSYASRGRGRGAKGLLREGDLPDATNNPSRARPLQREWNRMPGSPDGHIMEPDRRDREPPASYHFGRRAREARGWDEAEQYQNHPIHHSRQSNNKRHRSRSPGGSRSPSGGRSHRREKKLLRRKSRSVSPHLHRNARRAEKRRKRRHISEEGKHSGKSSGGSSDEINQEEETKGRRALYQVHKRMKKRWRVHSPEINGSVSSDDGDDSEDSDSSDDDDEENTKEPEIDSDEEVLAKRSSPPNIPLPVSPPDPPSPASPPSPPAYSPVGPASPVRPDSPAEPPPPPPSPPKTKQHPRSAQKSQVQQQRSTHQNQIDHQEHQPQSQYPYHQSSQQQAPSRPQQHPQQHAQPHPQQYAQPHPQQHPQQHSQPHPQQHPQQHAQHPHPQYSQHYQHRPHYPQQNSHPQHPAHSQPYSHPYPQHPQQPHQYSERPSHPGQYATHQTVSSGQYSYSHHHHPAASSAYPRAQAPAAANPRSAAPAQGTGATGHPSYQYYSRQPAATSSQAQPATTSYPQGTARPAYPPYSYQYAHPGYTMRHPYQNTSAAGHPYPYSQQGVYQGAPRASSAASAPAATVARTVHAHPGYGTSSALHPGGTGRPNTEVTGKLVGGRMSSPHSEATRPRVSSYRISPSEPSFKGVPTSDRIASNLLLDEVKKGFRQLVEDAVRTALKPAWSAKRVTKEDYKDIFKRAVDKVCGSKETVVQQDKIQLLVEAYVAKARKTRTS